MRLAARIDWRDALGSGLERTEAAAAVTVGCVWLMTPLLDEVVGGLTDGSCWTDWCGICSAGGEVVSTRMSRDGEGGRGDELFDAARRRWASRRAASGMEMCGEEKG